MAQGAVNTARDTVAVALRPGRLLGDRGGGHHGVGSLDRGAAHVRAGTQRGHYSTQMTHRLTLIKCSFLEFSTPHSQTVVGETMGGELGTGGGGGGCRQVQILRAVPVVLQGDPGFPSTRRSNWTCPNRLPGSVQDDVIKSLLLRKLCWDCVGLLRSVGAAAPVPACRTRLGGHARLPGVQS